VGIGGKFDQPTLLIDLDARDVFVTSAQVKDALGCTVARPFPTGFVEEDAESNAAR